MHDCDTVSCTYWGCPAIRHSCVIRRHRRWPLAHSLDDRTLEADIGVISHIFAVYLPWINQTFNQRGYAIVFVIAIGLLAVHFGLFIVFAVITFLIGGDRP